MVLTYSAGGLVDGWARARQPAQRVGGDRPV